MTSSVNNKHLFLFNACEQGDLETIKTHLNSQSSFEICSIRDENQATLLHYASRYGYLHILKYFIEIKYIDISQLHTEHGATCAHDAAVCDQTEILQYIFHHSKKLHWTVRDELGNTPLHLAANYNSLNVLHYLLEKEYADPHNQSYNGFLAIHYAAEHAHNDCIKLLLSKSPDIINKQTNQLITPLHLACQNGSLETIQLLISNGANFKVRNQNGSNCLHIACQNSHLNIVQWLIEKQNANINEFDYMNSTPIHYAAANGNEHIINYLLDKQAKIIIDNNGNTPLHVAAENGHHNVCVVLIERNCCSLLAVNNQQLTAADLAENSGYSSLANELRLRSNPSLLQKATVVRLVIKKRNVPRLDASCQVNEEDLMINNYSATQLNHQIEIQNGQHILINKGDISTSTSNLEDKVNDFIPRSSVVAVPKIQLNIRQNGI
ncbi:unnamed protein product [Adineta steineri]|uniref:Ankyrin repeat protein n=1 Tax=Adineta steineri TaxID=433720 RepID=A0A813VA89_9BILA|nr:unnamed protein product [Adineta steineri]